VTGVDDLAMIWIGSNAQSGWTRSNANIVAAYTSGPGNGTYSFNATQGSYTPFRIVFGQAQGGAIFLMSITNPTGATVATASTTFSQDIVQYGCSSANNAPAFAQWGQET